ncbi:MAG: threonine/serine dehydratase, partial [Candidatus Heimdallarchaeaceae archaeon]
MATEIREAYNRIKNVINKTPVHTSSTLNKMLNTRCFFKCENFQKMGAFKFRGAYHALSLLTAEERNRGVITDSSGNHAQALALAAKMFDIKATVVMPETAPKVKISAVREYGGEVVFCKPSMEARKNTVQQLIKKHGYTLVHSSNDLRIIQGAGTAAYELMNEVGRLDYIFAPVGGGGLLSGTALAVRELSPQTQVIGVEPRLADDAYRSFKEGKLYPSSYPNTIADGLRTSLGENTFRIIRENVNDIILVSEEEIVNAMQFLWERMKLV